MRISIIGQAGSGKSTLACQISRKLGIPHLHMDRLWFESGCKKLKSNDEEGLKKARACMEEKIKDFIKQNSWVSDGWYPEVKSIMVEDSDQIIFLDIPKIKI